MAKVGKISSIKRQPTSTVQTMENSLHARGFTRIPGTGVYRFPYKEINGEYRTGLNPSAGYIQRIQDPLEKELEIKRVTDLKSKLEAELRVDLGPRSPFWNHWLMDGEPHVTAIKLMDGDNFFDFTNPMNELAFSWLRVHPMIASSYQAWEKGEYPADTQFYVADDEIESQVVFKKKQLINKAISQFDSMSPEKKKKIARLLGLPVTDNTKEEVVYNLVDNLLKDTEFKKGQYAGLSTIQVFSKFANMDQQLLHVKDLVKQAINHSIYRVKQGGKIYEGELELAKDEDDLVKYLINEDHQEDLLVLEGKLKVKKIASV